MSAFTLNVERLRQGLHLQPVPYSADYVGREVNAGDVERAEYAQHADRDVSAACAVSEFIPAAVLLPIVLRESGATLLLTQRSAHLKDHPGQISFPGGRVELDDASSVDTALREAQEEIGLAASHIEVLGYLPDYRTGTGFCVTPVVALVNPPFDLHPDPFEVAEIFEVPIHFLMDTANHQAHSAHYRGQLRHYVAMPYGDRFIWGATAAMIVSLTQLLALA